MLWCAGVAVAAEVIVRWDEAIAVCTRSYVGGDAQAANDVKIAELTAQAERALGVARAEMERLARAARDTISEDRLREVLVTDTLPEVARAYAKSFDKIVVTGATDLSVLGQGVAQVLATADALGLRLPRSKP